MYIIGSVLMAAALGASQAEDKPIGQVVHERTTVFELKSGPMSGVAFSSCGKFLATATDLGSVPIWDATTGEKLFALGDNKGGIATVAFSPDGRFLACTGFKDDPARVWDLKTKKVHREFPVVGLGSCIVAFPPGRNELLIGDLAGRVTVWNPDTGKELGELKNADHVRCLAFSADGKILVTGSGYGRIQVWDGRTFALKKTIDDAHVGPVAAIASHPKLGVVSGSIRESFVKFWDPASGEMKQQVDLTKIMTCVTGIAILPGGESIAVVGGDKSFHLWHIGKAPEITATFVGHLNRLTCIAISPDGARLVSGSQDSSAKVWDIPKAK